MGLHEIDKGWKDCFYILGKKSGTFVKTISTLSYRKRTNSNKLINTKIVMFWQKEKARVKSAVRFFHSLSKGNSGRNFSPFFVISGFLFERPATCGRGG